MMELMMTHTVKRSMAMPGLAVWPLPLTYGNRPACPDLLPAGSAPATPLLFGRGGREGRRDGTAGTGGRRAGRDRHPRCRRYVQYCRASGAKCRGGDGRCHLRGTGPECESDCQIGSDELPEIGKQHATPRRSLRGCRCEAAGGGSAGSMPAAPAPKRRHRPAGLAGLARDAAQSFQGSGPPSRSVARLAPVERGDAAALPPPAASPTGGSTRRELTLGQAPSLRARGVLAEGRCREPRLI